MGGVVVGLGSRGLFVGVESWESGEVVRPEDKGGWGRDGFGGRGRGSSEPGAAVELGDQAS